MFLGGWLFGIPPGLRLCGSTRDGDSHRRDSPQRRREHRVKNASAMEQRMQADRAGLRGIRRCPGRSIRVRSRVRDEGPATTSTSIKDVQTPALQPTHRPVTQRGRPSYGSAPIASQGQSSICQLFRCGPIDFPANARAATASVECRDTTPLPICSPTLRRRIPDRKSNWHRGPKAARFGA